VRDSVPSSSTGVLELFPRAALGPTGVEAVSAPGDVVPANGSSQPGSVCVPCSRSAVRARSDGPLVAAPLDCPLLWLPSHKMFSVPNPVLIAARQRMPRGAREVATFLTSR